MKQRDGDGIANSSEVRGDVRGDKEESDVPFDPEATGVIPKLTLDTVTAEGPSSADAEPDADTTTVVRLPAALHIGRPPTVEEAADPDATGPDATGPDATGPDATGTVTTPVQEAVAPPTDSADASDTKPGLRPQAPSGPQPARPQPASGPQPAGPQPASGPQPVRSQPASGPQSARPQPVSGPQPVQPQPPSGPQRVDGARADGDGSGGASASSAATAATPATATAATAKGATPTKGAAPTAPPGEAPAKGPDAKPAGKEPSGGASPAKRPVTETSAAGTVPVPIVRPASAPASPPASAPASPAASGPAGGTAAQGAAAAPVEAPRQASPMPAVAPPTAPLPGAAPQGATKQATPPQAAPQAAPGKPRTLGGRIGALVASAPKWLPVLLVLEGLVMYILALKVAPGPLRGVDPKNIDGLGLISALPTTAFIAILIMLVSFFVTVAQSTDRKFLLLFQIAAITFALHGAGALVATAPRFPTAYIHAGFVEFIARTGESAISIDARMGWPGFFALFAFVTKAAGITDLTPILQWTPLVSNLLYLLPFVLILRQVVATTRARWFAALLFVLVQWIGQDYFSPQGFTFALYLAFIAILLRWFGRVEQRTKPIPPKGLRKLLAKLDSMTPGELANTGTYRADKLLMLMMLLALFFAAVASHQITPFMMLGVVTAFLIFKRTSLTWALPFFLGLVVLAWISYMTVGFWSSQIGAIFGGFGRILQNIGNSTGDRIEGSDPAHALVLQARLGILVVILSLAATGLFRRFRRGVFDRSALILLCVPVLALGLQSYGGEIGLRIYMFALPGACLLAAYAFFPNLPADSADVREETVPLRRRNVRFNPQLTKKLSVVLAACFAVLFAFAFLLARYGNEKFERVTTGEVAALHYVYQHDKPSAKVLYLVPKTGPEVTPTLPWGEKDVELVNFGVQALVHKDPTQVADAIAALKEQPRNSYLIVSRGQVSYLQLNEGFPDDWGAKFRAALDASPDLKRVFSNEDAALYTWKKFVRGTEIPEPQPYKGRGDPTTPWTPVGVGALAVTWVSLFAYEVIRLNGPNRARKARKRLLFLAVPAFAVALAVIIERFIYIAQNN
ncbi:hypothetical protein ACIBQ1_28130 [Nonomuraea sp. NPDC050153]|uniref:hypothetical protein n=1 Tax=Nonomuraea sp. NPDC050153 TaxID=3364359 RepID=UPI0037A08812